MSIVRGILASYLILFGIQAGAQNLCSVVFTKSALTFESKHLKETKALVDADGLGVLLIQKKANEEWYDFKTAPDRPGDVRWGMEYLPESLRQLLNLAAYDAHGKPVAVTSENLRTLQLPTTKLIQQKFAKLAAKLKIVMPDHLLIQYYETKEITSSNRLYLENFVKESKLPLSDQGHLYEHDLNYHVYSSFVLPKRFVEALKIRAELLLEFNAFIKKEAEHSNQAKEIAKIISSIVLHDYVSRVDASTGNMFQVVVGMEKENLNLIMSEMMIILEYSLINQPSPQLHLLHLLNRPELNESMLPYLQKFLSSLPEKYKKEDLDQTFLQNPAELYNESRSVFKQITKAAEGL
jgi:hypothetical protein